MWTLSDLYRISSAFLLHCVAERIAVSRRGCRTGRETSLSDIFQGIRIALCSKVWLMNEKLTCRHSVRKLLCVGMLEGTHLEMTATFILKQITLAIIH